LTESQARNFQGDTTSSPPSTSDVFLPTKSNYFWPKLKLTPERPDFLQQYPVPEGGTYNVNSFLGINETYKGKFFVPREQYGRFIEEYYAAFKAGYRMFLTENYHNQPFRYFLELDFDWELDPDFVMEATLRIIDITLAAVQAVHELPDPPRYLVTIRTPHKVHLNFPDVITTEPLALQCREAIVRECRAVLGEAKQDWEKVIDFPHGSFRMIGSRKTRNLDSDPPWVYDKAYYPVRLEEGVWKARGINIPLLKAASIFPSVRQLREFEQSPAFLKLAYADQSAYLKRLEERRQRRQELRRQRGLPDLPASPSPVPRAHNTAEPGGSPRGPPPKKGPVAVKLFVDPVDERVRVQMKLRKWALREMYASPASAPGGQESPSEAGKAQLAEDGERAQDVSGQQGAPAQVLDEPDQEQEQGQGKVQG